MDIHLPDDSGIEAARRIRAEFPRIKTLALSSDSSPATVVEALQAGFSGYLLKENSASELLNAIRTVVSYKLYLCPEIASVVVDAIGHVVNSQHSKRRDFRALMLPNKCRWQSGGMDQRGIAIPSTP